MANPLARLAVRAVAAAATRQIASRVAGTNLGPISNVASVALPFVLRRVAAGPCSHGGGGVGVGQLAKAAPAPQPARRAPIVTPPPIPWATPNDAF